MKVILQILESFRFAWNALKSNLLRTILSLLGVTVGIFAIIAVLTFVDSLEKNIKEGLSFIGSGVIYVQKMPWLPEGGGEYKWWEYFRRPAPSFAEYKFLKENLKHIEAMSIWSDRFNLIIKYESNSIGQIRVVGASEGYEQVYEIPVEKGRYLTLDELAAGRNSAVIGFEVAKALFTGGEEPLGKFIKIRNIKFLVVGVIKQEGQGFFGNTTNDFGIIIPYNAYRKWVPTGTGRWNEVQSTIALKGKEEDIGMIELENETRGLLRSKRGVRPTQKDNFALNRPEAIINVISGVFDVVGVAGWIIGGFSILVGGFGIANIMFVSVKERTPIIGLQKSVGAKNYFILFQFLFEAIFLCLIGGLTGLLLVYLITFIPLGNLVVTLSIKNIVLGLGVSTAIGIVSGIIPAAVAARLDPVIAIRAT
ncbi:MAG: ABC transporter permease [Cyclobacteriaceae bacterium]|jgi:putative ABC transport system permease protein|nr:ABC transporter permease [Cyclobacteriaceae bacterium]